MGKLHDRLRRNKLLDTTAFSTNAQSLRAAWKMIQPYWSSEDKWKGFGLLGATVGLAMTQVGLGVLSNQWSKNFYNAIQEYDGSEFTKQLGVYTALTLASVAVAVYQTYTAQALQIRWRKWMTDQYLDKWMANKAFYHLQSQSASGEGAGKAADNPDQRIADDLNHLTGGTLDLSIGLLTNAMNLAIFTNLLWHLPHSTASFKLHEPINWALSKLPDVATNQSLQNFFSSHTVAFNDVHYLVWSALAYATAGTYLMHKAGRKMIDLNYNQQKYEADLRYSMVRVRENAESIALSGGEKVEIASIRQRFNDVVKNWKEIMKKQKQISSLTLTFDQAIAVFPSLMVAPLYFNRIIKLGTMTQISSAFNKVQRSMLWFVDTYPKLANWRAASNRLTEFTAAIDQVKKEENAATIPAPPAPKPA